MDRLEVLEEIFTKAVAECESPQYSSYLMTKMFGYRMIAERFSGRNVLELGCDGSPTTSLLVRWSEKLTVVDVEDKFSPKIPSDPELGKAEFHCSLWENFDTGEKYSDIILTDSLEHVEDALTVLRKCRTLLDAGGRLHIIVPNALSLHRLLGVEMGFLRTPYDFNDNDISSGHVRVYDPDTLQADIDEAGLKTEIMRGIQLKPMTDGQLSKFSREYMEGLYGLSETFSRYCAEIYASCVL